MSVFCPNCAKIELESIDIDGVVVDCCENCEGIYYDHAELQKIIENTFEDSVEIITKFLDVIHSNKVSEDKRKICPKDGKEMYSVEFPINSGIIIDVCPQCKGVWTDKDETQKILKQFLKIESAETPGAPPKDFPQSKHWSAKPIHSFIHLFR